jgi:putative DNA primase/helicase
MLALMRYPNGEIASLHRTYLTSSGQKAKVSPVRKYMAGKPLNSASAQFSEVEPRIGIAEGIETALAASTRFKMPVWAATNAALLEGWVPPAGVEYVLIAGDHDANYVGQAEAVNLAKRLVPEPKTDHKNKLTCSTK